MKIGIIGAGKIGLTLGQLAEKYGGNAIYVDVKPPYVNDYNLLIDCDVNFICVNTAFDEIYNAQNIVLCLSKAKEYGLKNLVIVSTCPPSFFDLPEFQVLSEDLVYHPLFIRQGSIEDDILYADFNLVGYKNSINLEPLISYYKLIGGCRHYVKVGFKEASIIKMGINGFLTLKIAYANMIGDFCVEQNLDPKTVLNAIGNFEPINNLYFGYGYGYGGPCLPIDNNSLYKEINRNLPIAVDDENKKHLDFQINEFIKTNNKNKEYVFEKVGYKPNLPIITCSQKLEMAYRLASLGYNIKIKDSKEICDLVESKYPKIFSFDKLS